jgi:bifunctional enzyme CysN/CysC/sulfate adenylyltransferase subunit 1
VQWVVRPQSDAYPDYRGYAGQVAGGVFKPGDDVVVLPSGLETTIAAIDTFDGSVAEAYPPMSVTVRLADDLDVSRGDVLARPHNQPTSSQDLDVMVSWMADRPLAERNMYAVKHTTNNVRAMVTEVDYRLDVNTLHRDEDATQLGLNDIGRVRLRATQPVHYDAYGRNRLTGALIFIDEGTDTTVGAGMIVER